MKICVQGLWHLGIVTASCLASLGYEVIGLDDDENNIKSISSGKVPVYEPGLKELLKSGINNRRLSFTSSKQVALKSADILWVAFDTKVDNKDRADIELIQSKIQKTITYLKKNAIIIISSQLPVGSVKKLENFSKRNLNKKNFKFSCIPENLKLGEALDSFLKPERLIVGIRDQYCKKLLLNLITPITDKIEWMSIESAEMTKHAINSFLATSVTFANEIAKICEHVGADAKEVERGLKTESRIGPKAYLSPGNSFAGGTLARDVTYLNNEAKKNKLKIPLLSSIHASNNEHKKWLNKSIVEKIGNLSNITVAVWGLTYKTGTDTLRRSLNIELCIWLVKMGINVNIYDPVIKECPKQLVNKVYYGKGPLDIVESADALILGTNWPEFKKVAKKLSTKTKPGFIIFDPNRYLEDHINKYEFKYYSVGMPKGEY